MDAKPNRAWLDKDLKQYIASDCEIDTLPIEVQIMLDLADNLADARRLWLPKRPPTGGGEYPRREPRHAQRSEPFRRGRDPGGRR